MRWLGSWGIVMLLLSACTRDNAAFEGGEGEGEGEGEEGDATRGGGTTSGVSTGGSMEGSASVTRTTTADASADDTRGSNDGLGTTSSDSGEQVDTGAVCELVFPAPYGIGSDRPFEELFGGCPEHASLRLDGSFSDGSAVFGGDICPSCDCEEDPITLDFGMALPPVEGCFELSLQLEPGTCEVVAYMIVPFSEGFTQPPVAVVSNVVAPTFFGSPNPVPLVRAMEPAYECDQGCPSPSGYYDLLPMFGGPAIPPGEPVMVEQYVLLNDDSGIDANCEEVGRWHAMVDF